MAIQNTTTNPSFQTMLNQYLTYDLLKEEMIKRDFMLSKVDKDNGWKGGALIVPFKGSYASSVRMGKLTAESDISEDVYVRGQITSQPEIWGSMKFYHKDIMQHNGRVNEDSFIKVLPGALEDFMDNMKAMVSQQLLSGASVVKILDNATAAGVATVDRVERLCLGMKVRMTSDVVVVPIVGYISKINVNTSVVTVSATRPTSYNPLAGDAVLDLSTLDAVDNPKMYLDDANIADNSFTSLKSTLISGGTIYGITKTDFPYTQAINISGSTITATNIVAKLFDAQNIIRQRGKGNPTDAIVSYKWLAAIMAGVEASKGAFKVAEGSTKASLYNWQTVTINGVKGTLTVHGVYEMDDDFIPIVDWRALKFHSNGFFQKRTAPDGKQYFETRGESGYAYIVDVCLMGDLVNSRPSYCGIIHSIP